MKMKFVEYVKIHCRNGKHGKYKNEKWKPIHHLYGQEFMDWFDKEYGLTPIIVPKVL